MIEQARDFALAKHAGQIRNLPDGSEPYFCHLMRVAEMVSNITEDVSCIIAALLHDTVEDTETTLAEIEAAFGPTVARLVDGLTDNYTPARHPDMNRKARTFLIEDGNHFFFYFKSVYGGHEIHRNKGVINFLVICEFYLF